MGQQFFNAFKKVVESAPKNVMQVFNQIQQSSYVQQEVVLIAKENFANM